MKLLAMKIELVDGPTWQDPSFECELWYTRDELEVPYVDGFPGTVLLMSRWPHGCEV